MGFIKWLISQYRMYKFQETFQKRNEMDEEEKFISNYEKCIEAGFTKKQLNALIDLWGSK